MITRAARTSALLPLLRAAHLVREDRRTTGASYVTASASPRWFHSLPRESAVSTKQSMVKADSDRSALAWAKWIMLMVAPTAQAQLATCGDADGEGGGTAAVSDAECGTGLIYNSVAASGVCAGLTCDVAADQTACCSSCPGLESISGSFSAADVGGNSYAIDFVSGGQWTVTQTDPSGNPFSLGTRTSVDYATSSAAFSGGDGTDPPPLSPVRLNACATTVRTNTPIRLQAVVFRCLVR